MAEPASGGRGAASYIFELEKVKSPPSSSTTTTRATSPSSTLAISTRKPRTQSKRPNQTYNEATALLSFTDLTYSVKVRRKLTWRRSVPSDPGAPSGSLFSSKTKTLLSGISGEARDGEILAVLGACGSGKSTLIDALANRIVKGILKGNVTLNGEVLNSKMQKAISADVMQDDLLFPMLTVEETLMFAAEVRLPRRLSKSKKSLRVQALIDQLGLRNAANTVIGDEGHRGISGGERRRVSIGIDIIHDPILLFLDEPTSGLESARKSFHSQGTRRKIQGRNRRRLIS